ncbi:MAG: S46 family peptidase [Rhodopirellula sp.]|nr:S46 family peptidase [Rhodopirellula sp.]
MQTQPRWLLIATLFFLTAALARADEGMWLFSDPPRDLLKTKYDFDPSPEWLEHLQRSSVRFNNGGSGSFVSADGLVMTNHHVGSGALQKLSTAGRDYLATGFLAKTPDEELRCHDLELNVLVSIEDVTDRIEAAVKPDHSPQQAYEARRAAMNTIEQQSLEKTGLRSDVVTLYHGGLYHLYRYQRYTDVRLVFAPEVDIAFFGGDPDNFEYPRYCLDICFFRVYENDKPAKIEHYLRWSPGGVDDGELVFVSGHPGRTNRLKTVAHLKFLRDRILPAQLDEVRRREILLEIYGGRSREAERQAQQELFGYRNRRKALLGALAGLQDPEIMKRKTAEEEAIRRALAGRPELEAKYADAWQKVAGAIDQWAEIEEEYHLLEAAAAFNSQLFHTARHIVRLAEESEKPNAERLREYRQSNLASLRQQLFSAAPIYPELEITRLADSLGMYAEMAGIESPMVRKVLSGKSPQARAEELIGGTRLANPAQRKTLVEGGPAAVRASADPMIDLVRLVDPPARALRKQFDENVEEPLNQAYGKIARARFALGGKDVYPDATFTLRLALGVVRGLEQAGQAVPPWTTIGGAYLHAAEHGDTAPFKLPRSWTEHKDDLALNTPLNFVSTNDIIGGNSGSPVVNRDGELVGIIFDGNRYSLVWGFVYDDEQGRAVAVDSRAITEALNKVYSAINVVEELGVRR